MGDGYRESRYRDRDGSESGEERYRTTKVRRYKIKPGRDDHYESFEVDDEPRSRYSGLPVRTRDDYYDFDRRPERPRSEYIPRSEHLDDRRSAYYEPEKDFHKDADPGRITVWEPKESDVDFDRRSRYSRHDDEIRVEKEYEGRYKDSHGHDVDRIQKETEYYIRPSPPPSPVIVRQRAEPQKIIFQEAPPPAPIVVPRQEPNIVMLREKEPVREMVRREKEPAREMVRRERDRPEEEYYYRHEEYDGPYRSRSDLDRERDYALARMDHHRRHHDSYSDDEDYYVHHRRIVRKERSESPHRKRILAAGALAGAGVTALLSSRRDENGDLPEHRRRKVLAGSALGAIGTEALRRAYSAHEEKHGGSPDSHSTLKKALGVAAVGLAAAGAAKYMQANKVEKEESSRGRSRRRSHSVATSRFGSGSRAGSRSRRRSVSVAKAALGTAATAGLIKKLRSRSRRKSGDRSRSKSKIRHLAEIGGAATAAGVAAKLWDKRAEKKNKEDDERELSRERERSRRHSTRGRSRDRSWSRSPSRGPSRASSRAPSRSRSRAPSARNRSPGSEIGLIEYGHDPLGPPPSKAAHGYESEAEERRRRQRRSRGRSHSSDEGEARDRHARSKSRLRDMAAGGAAALGIKEFRSQKEEEDLDRRSRERQAREEMRQRDRMEGRDRSRSRSRGGPRGPDYFGDYNGRTSPPTASGGAYYPPYPSTPGGEEGPVGYGNPAMPEANLYHNNRYVPQDYTGYVPPRTPGENVGMGINGGVGLPPAPPAGPPPRPRSSTGNYPPEHVSEDPLLRGSEEGASDRTPQKPPSEAPKPPTEAPPRAKSVVFGPLSPRSSVTMERHRRGFFDENKDMKRPAPLLLENGPSDSPDTPDSPEKPKDDRSGRDSSSERRIVRIRPQDLLAGSQDRARQRRNESNDRSKRDESDDRDNHNKRGEREERDPSSERRIVRRPSRKSRSPASESDDDIEVLPDRFDDDGSPVSEHRPRRSHHRNSRSADYHHRSRHPDEQDRRGSWQFGGADPQLMDTVVRGVTSVMEGKKDWVSLLGDVLGSGVIGGLGAQALQEEDDHDRRRHRHR
ncbi:unnamed protein product [Clonostachys chloroleuca]|uniref:DUF3824 domain-containing protein n=1 Tax=Clonostachys chloroleuca TaxID=1926264 RepID=A0AA35MJB6_9HYPO|nr:unnamed protein product [Clonostachys chloroleuca]